MENETGVRVVVGLRNLGREETLGEAHGFGSV